MGCLSKEDIQCMVQEAKEFPNENEAQRTYIKALDTLLLFVYHLKGQLGDQEGVPGNQSWETD